MRESTSPAAEGIHTNANDIEVASTWLVLVHAHCPYLLLPVIPYVARTSPSSTTSNPPPLPLTRLLLRSHVLLSVMLWSRRAGLFLAMPHLPPSLMPITHCVDRTSPSSIADTPPPHSRARRLQPRVLPSVLCPRRNRTRPQPTYSGPVHDTCDGSGITPLCLFGPPLYEGLEHIFISDLAQTYRRPDTINLISNSSFLPSCQTWVGKKFSPSPGSSCSNRASEWWGDRPLGFVLAPR